MGAKTIQQANENLIVVEGRSENLENIFQNDEIRVTEIIPQRTPVPEPPPPRPLRSPNSARLLYCRQCKSIQCHWMWFINLNEWWECCNCHIHHPSKKSAFMIPVNINSVSEIDLNIDHDYDMWYESVYKATGRVEYEKYFKQVMGQLLIRMQEEEGTIMTGFPDDIQFNLYVFHNNGTICYYNRSYSGYFFHDVFASIFRYHTGAIKEGGCGSLDSFKSSHDSYKEYMEIKRIYGRRVEGHRFRYHGHKSTYIMYRHLVPDVIIEENIAELDDYIAKIDIDYSFISF